MGLVAVADKKDAKGRTQAEEDEPILLCRMIGIVNQEGILIKEDGSGLFKGNLVPSEVDGVLGGIPFELQVDSLALHCNGMGARCQAILEHHHHAKAPRTWGRA